MIAGRKASTGALHITTALPGLTSVSLGGVAMLPNGVVHAAPATEPDRFVNGFGVTDAGALCVAIGDVTAGFQQGLPFTAIGLLVCQMNQTPAPTDPFVGGLRIGPLGGLYVTDAVPARASFSGAFSDAFNVVAP